MIDLRKEKRGAGREGDEEDEGDDAWLMVVTRGDDDGVEELVDGG